VRGVKYARLESERRFLLAALPDLPVLRVLRITDRYVHGTRLRVRLVEEDGQEPVRKLGQKVRLAEDAPSVNAHTTLYLDAPEFALLAALPAAVLAKKRHFLGDGWVVDVHAGGLVLAETEGTGEPPFSYVREVTEELAYTGGALAFR
jgi:hypothetical protein